MGKLLTKILMAVVLFLVILQVPATLYAATSVAVTGVSPSGAVATTTPTYVWVAESLATKYRLVVLNSKKMAAQDRWYTKAEAGCSTGSGNCSITPSASLLAGSYTWYAIADLGATVRALSPMGFTATPATMANGSPSGQLTSSPSSFSWNATAGSSSYLLTITKLGTTVFTRQVSAADAGCSTGVGTCRASPGITFTNGTYAWTIKPFSNGTFQANTVTTSFTLTLATVSPLLVSPLGTLSTNVPTYVWNAEAGATNYSLKVTNSSGLVLHFANLTPTAAGCAAGTGTCATTPAVSLPSGAVKWSILVTPSGRIGETVVSVSPPSLGTPSPGTPKGTIFVTTPDFSWNAIQGASHYRLRVTDSSNALVINKTYSVSEAGCSSGSGTCSVSPGVTMATGSGFWTIAALNTATGATGVDSSRQAFTIAEPAAMPGTPTPLAPAGAVATLSPTFSWTVASAADSYIVRVTDASGRTVPRIVSATQAGCTSSGSTCTTRFPDPFMAGSGSWAVQAFSSVTNLNGTPSSSLGFILSTEPANSTLLVAPVGTSLTNTPTYTWNAEAGATGYALKVTNSSGAVLHFANLSPTTAGCASGTGTCSSTPAVPLPSGTVKWSVIVSPTKTTAEATFTVAMPALGTPSPFAPKGTVADLTPDFSWGAIQGASHYRLRVADANSLVISQTYSAAEAGCPSGTGTCSVSPGTALTPGNGYWAVMAQNTTNGTESLESSRTAFTVVQPSAIPTTPTLIAPTGAVSTLSPTFTWNSSSYANSYIVKVTDASNGTVTSIVSAAQGGCESSGSTCTTRFANPFVAGPGSWTVQAFNSVSGLSGAVSNSLSFVLSPDVPSTIQISPKGDIYDTSPTLTWTAVADATKYLVKIKTTQSTSMTYLQQTYTPAEAGCPDGTGQCSVTPSIQLGLGGYLWSVSTMPVVRVFEQRFNIVRGTLALSADSVAENTPTPVKIGTLSFNGSSTGNIAYTINGINDFALFEIKNSNELWVKAGVSLDYESKLTLSVQIAAGGTVQSFPVHVTDVNEAPTGITLSNYKVDENKDTGTNVALATLTGADPDKSSQFLSHVFSIAGGTDQSKFAINGATLELKAGTVLDYETNTAHALGVQIKVTDGGNLSYTQDVTIGINDINETPTAIILSVSAINENVDTATNATLGTLATVDTDANDTFTYSITGGANKELFVISGSSLQLKAGTAINYEAMTTPSLNLELSTTDSGGLTFSKSFTLAVNDVNEAPTAISLSPGIVYSNANPAVAMDTGTMTITDPDANDAHTCAVSGGADQANFQVDGLKLQLKAGTVLNISTKPTYTVEVTCTDKGSLAFAKSLTVTLQAIDRSITLANPSIDENTSTVADVNLGTLIAVGNNTFAIAGGTDQAFFKLVGSQLFIKAGTSLDYEAKSSYSVTISNSDALGSYTATLTITVKDINETPTNISLSNTVLPFIARPTNAAVGVLSTTDQDANESFVYSLPDNLNGRFTILGDQLFVVETSTPVHGIFALPIRVTDKGGLTYEKNFPITVVGFSVETIPDSPDVPTMISSARATYANIYKNLLLASAGQEVVVSEEEFENLILGKISQQMTAQGTFTHTLPDIVNKFDIQITADLVTATMKVALVDIIYSRLSASTQNLAQSVLTSLAPYASGYVLGVRLRVKPVISGLNVSFDTTASYVDLVDESDYIPTLSMQVDTLVSAYNSVVNALASNDSLAFFLGGGAQPPTHFLKESFGSASQASAVSQSNLDLQLDTNLPRGGNTLAGMNQGGLLIPTTQRIDYYFPGLVAAALLQNNSVSLTRSSLTFTAAP